MQVFVAVYAVLVVTSRWVVKTLDTVRVGGYGLCHGDSGMTSTSFVGLFMVSSSRMEASEK